MDVEVTNNAERGRYELRVDGQLVGIADYLVDETTVIFPHTEIDPVWRDQGYGDRLIRAALDDVRQAGRSIAPRCWYVAQFVRDNPEYADMVSPTGSSAGGPAVRGTASPPGTSSTGRT
jgi:predicted GNAT family acetyltransferase